MEPLQMTRDRLYEVANISPAEGAATQKKLDRLVSTRGRGFSVVGPLL